METIIIITTHLLAAWWGYRAGSMRHHIPEIPTEENPGPNLNSKRHD